MVIGLGFFYTLTPTTEAHPHELYTPAVRPPVSEIPPEGLGRNFELVAHLPLLDDYQWVNEPMGIPRGDNGDITLSDHCVYVGAIMGYQPALIVDVSNPAEPRVVGPVPDLVQGRMNGGEGIEASGNLLVIDQRNPVEGLAFPPEEGLPNNGLAIYDISDCEQPTLVARYDFGDDSPTHLHSLWRDPEDPERVLVLWTSGSGGRIEPGIDLHVVDLTGCPADCNPTLAAKWGMGAQFGTQSRSTHEAVMSTDGMRIYMAQNQEGFFMLDSSRLINTLRSGGEFTARPGENDCHPAAPQSPEAEGHCLTALNPDITARDRSSPLMDHEWYHTPIKVPGRPYAVVMSESREAQSATQVGAEPFDPLGPVRPSCPGALIRIIYIGEDEFNWGYGDNGKLMRGDLYPETIGTFGTQEQLFENCGPNGEVEGTSQRRAAYSWHNALVLPNIVFATFYGGGLRAIDISVPFNPVEVGHYFGRPVDEVRWAHEIADETVLRDDGLALMKPSIGQPDLIHFSYVVSYNGNLIFADINNGLYIVKYTGPHAEEIPAEGNCVSGNPGAVEPGYEPCPPYGQTDWGTITEPEEAEEE